MPKKLKRFLLRYDPPGIGLEVAEGDELSIHHVDLKDKVHVVEDIYAEVDRLIDMEAELLTRKRHRGALVQLLSRLYKIDVDEAEDQDSPKGKQSSPKAASPMDSLQEGGQVVLINFRQEQADVVHNGEMGTLTKCRHDKKKYEVTMKKSGEVVKVKDPSHIIGIAPKTTLAVNAMVVIRGLRNHTELNGCLGRVVECHEETHRFEVRAIESGQLFRVKQENLVLIEPSSVPANMAKENREPNTNASPRGLRKDATGAASSSGINDSATSLAAGGDDIFEPGALVELQGLQTAKTYNGQQAEVLSADRARQRYEIRLDDGSVKTIRAENVKLISRPSKSSPRNPRRKEGATKAADRGK
eukprot:CAMPEP_0115251956 /NCGR_PEP_ID=MMETSP0270-20121206/43901_1 /TAXON_ID=71861 /ORGANISM="Scrippsiella trochoidea, Strain CCMP3099" /LENGTH=357 /DNA_ID=CAMNT_0002667401 /DNA_START=6 /DNA_END=1079 /DNA_ORIENTATION=+